MPYQQILDHRSNLQINECFTGVDYLVIILSHLLQFLYPPKIFLSWTKRFPKFLFLKQDIKCRLHFFVLRLSKDLIFNVSDKIKFHKSDFQIHQIKLFLASRFLIFNFNLTIPMLQLFKTKTTRISMNKPELEGTNLEMSWYWYRCQWRLAGVHSLWPMAWDQHKRMQNKFVNC